jgi:hypothetical protein
VELAEQQIQVVEVVVDQVEQDFFVENLVLVVQVLL